MWRNPAWRSRPNCYARLATWLRTGKAKASETRRSDAGEPDTGTTRPSGSEGAGRKPTAESPHGAALPPYAMHLYQDGIPLSYIKDFLGHVSINTTDIYAAADPSMLRAALEKIDTREAGPASAAAPMWQDNEDMILKLCGLK